MDDSNPLIRALQSLLQNGGSSTWPGMPAFQQQFAAGNADAAQTLQHHLATLASGTANGAVDFPHDMEAAAREATPPQPTHEGMLPAFPSWGNPIIPALSKRLPQSRVNNQSDADLKQAATVVGGFLGPEAYANALKYGVKGLSAYSDFFARPPAYAGPPAQGAVRLGAGNTTVPPGGAAPIRDLVSPDVADAHTANLQSAMTQSMPPEMAKAYVKYLRTLAGSKESPIHNTPIMGELASQTLNRLDENQVLRQRPSVENVLGKWSIPEEMGPEANPGTWGALDSHILDPTNARYVYGDAAGLNTPEFKMDRMADSGIPEPYRIKQYDALQPRSAILGMPQTNYIPPVLGDAFDDLVGNLRGADISRMDFPTMVQQGNKNYEQALLEQMKRNKGEHILDTGDGMNWQELTEPHQLQWEGNDRNMAHCIKDPYYCRNVQQGNTRVFSLRRNDNNQPVLTVSTGNDQFRYYHAPDWLPRESIEQPTDVIGQIKGRANAIKPKYAPNVQQLIDHLDLDPSQSGDYYKMFPEEAQKRQQELRAQQSQPTSAPGFRDLEQVREANEHMLAPEPAMHPLFGPNLQMEHEMMTRPGAPPYRRVLTNPSDVANWLNAQIPLSHPGYYSTRSFEGQRLPVYVNVADPTSGQNIVRPIAHPYDHELNLDIF